MSLRDQLFGEQSSPTAIRTFRVVRSPGRSLRDRDDAVAAAELWRLRQASRLIRSVYGADGTR